MTVRVDFSKSLWTCQMNYIFSFCNFNDKKNLSETNKKIDEVINFFRKELSISRELWPTERKLIFPALLRLLAKSPNITFYDGHKTPNDDTQLNVITKLLPNINFFASQDVDSIYNISVIGLNHLVENCKKISAVAFNFKHITDEEVGNFSLKLPNLRKISMHTPKELTHKGLCNLIKNYRQLEAIELLHFYDFTPSVLSALAENCKNLKFLSHTYGDSKGLTVEIVREFVKNCSSLRYLLLSSPSGVLAPILKEFPHIQRPKSRMFYEI